MLLNSGCIEIYKNIELVTGSMLQKSGGYCNYPQKMQVHAYSKSDNCNFV